MISTQNDRRTYLLISLKFRTIFITKVFFLRTFANAFQVEYFFSSNQTPFLCNRLSIYLYMVCPQVSFSFHRFIVSEIPELFSLTKPLASINYFCY